MPKDRPFDDGRYPDLEGRADCFLCGRPVDPSDPHRGSFEEGVVTPAGVTAGAALPIHLPCLNRVSGPARTAAYLIAIREMARHATPMVS